MLKRVPVRQFLASDFAPLVLLALVKLILHFATNHQLLGYGYFRDEFYYLACAERLDFGYVDHPPLALLLLSINRWLLGDSLFALRLLPALAGAGTVFLTGLIARQLGGSKHAQVLAALAALVAPAILVMDGFFSPNALEILWWTWCAYLLVLLFKQDKPRLWPWVGFVAGIGLQTKHTFVLFGLGMVLGLLLTQARKYFRSKWLWLGALIALLIFLPNLAWQVGNGWPSLEFYVNATAKNAPTPPWAVLAIQILALNPISFPLWLAGLWYFLLARDGKPYRVLVWIYLVNLLFLMVTQSSRPDRAAGAYPMLLAAGALVLERLLRLSQRRLLAVVTVVLVVICGVILAPMGLPVLPPETMIQYAAALGLSDIASERGVKAALPNYFADRFGWGGMVATVAQVYDGLPPEEQAKATILTGNYGEAGAIDLLGRAYDLPRATSGHNNYYLWGPDTSSEVVIALGVSRGHLRRTFESVTEAAIVRCDYCLNYENNLRVFVARGPRYPIQEMWPDLRHYQ